MNNIVLTQDWTIKDLGKALSLTSDFIRKCLDKLTEEGILVKGTHFIEGGPNNAILITNTGFKIFERVAELKNKLGYAIPAIRDTLINDDRIPVSTPYPNLSNQTTQTYQNQPQPDYMEKVIDTLKDTYKDALMAKEQAIQAHQSAIKTLESKILLITDGRDPQEVKRENERKQEELFKLQNELQLKEKLIEEQKKKEAQFLIEKEQEIYQIKLVSEQKEKELERVRLISEKRQDLLKKLSELEGTWFTSGKRKQLLKELESLG